MILTSNVAARAHRSLVLHKMREAEHDRFKNNVTHILINNEYIESLLLGQMDHLILNQSEKYGDD